MLDCQSFLDLIKHHGVSFSTGVPDSLLKNICACISDQGMDIIAANEGAAIALAAGHHLATGKVPFVYMQNSGFGNTINPITSLVDPEVYSIPMLLMIGWRGQPGAKDEPQHVKQGRINESLLKSLEIPYCILSGEFVKAEKQIEDAFSYMKENSAPYALLVENGTFAPYKMGETQTVPHYEMKREDAVKVVLKQLSERDIIVSTTGKTSREVFEERAARQEGHEKDFLTVGCMGHASQIALGIALEQPSRKIYCLDGDGAFLMHMGSAAIIADQAGPNYKHILINNGSHDSVGGQLSVGFKVDFCRIAEGCGYKKAWRVESQQELEKIWPEFETTGGPVLLEIRTTKGAREDLGRPTIKPINNKADFMKNLAK